MFYESIAVSLFACLPISVLLVARVFTACMSHLYALLG